MYIYALYPVFSLPCCMAYGIRQACCVVIGILYSGSCTIPSAWFRLLRRRVKTGKFGVPGAGIQGDIASGASSLEGQEEALSVPQLRCCKHRCRQQANCTAKRCSSGRCDCPSAPANATAPPASLLNLLQRAVHLAHALQKVNQVLPALVTRDVALDHTPPL